MKNLVILGAKLGPDAVDIIDSLNLSAGKNIYHCLGFLDDDKSLWGKDFYGTKVHGPISLASEFKDTYFVSLIGGPNSYFRKKEILDKARISDSRFVNLIHPLAYVAKTAKLGKDVVLYPGVVIGSYSKIGNHVLVGAHSVTGEGTTIGSYSTVLLGVVMSGFAMVNKSCLLGNGCTVRNRVSIGQSSFVGLGSVVFENVPPNRVVVGNPAKIVGVRPK